MSEQTEIRRVALVHKHGEPEARRLAAEVADWLRRRDLTVELPPPAEGGTERTDVRDGVDLPSGSTADLVVVLGGDGTLLSVARAIQGGAPILGVNLGTLGFLTEINRGELYPSLVEVLAGRYDIEERSLFEVELRRAAGEVARYRVFNDAVVNKSALARMIRMVVRIDGRFVAVYRADGLILSTPTGSTAYNLSAGGPIVHPALPVAVITPICPHTLSQRPLVVPDGCEIEVTLDTAQEEVYLTLDGQEGGTLRHRDAIRVRVAPERVRLVQVSRRSFYDALRNKLRWGE
ncbi:MAG TPA: NAD(+)/NADH kinase [Thermoanaerobaculia bacterium]|nr:NAD(+)/NADH kinase [Thermoanaerobaculia bacterium]